MISTCSDAKTNRFYAIFTAATLAFFAGGAVALAQAPAGAPAAAPSVAPASTPAAPPASKPASSPVSKPAPVKLDLAKTVVIGASVSDGFGAQATFEVPNPDLGKPETPADAPETIRRSLPVRLAEALQAAVGGEGKPLSSASMMFFARPTETAEAQLKKAIEAKPEVVFAIDYLFWHSYGAMAAEVRPVRLAEGLARLEKFTCPVVIGDLPDMRHATMMLSPSQVPSVEQLVTLNQQVLDWAKERPNVVIVPLKSLVAAIRSNSGIKLGGTEYNVEQARDLMTTDGLHATGLGLVALAQECLIQLKSAKLLTEDSTFEPNAKVGLERIKPSRTEVRSPRQAPASVAPAAANPKSVAPEKKPAPEPVK